MKRVLALSLIGLLLLPVFPAMAADVPAVDEAASASEQPPKVEKGGTNIVFAAGEVVGGYVWNRVRDFGDIFTLKLGWGTANSIGFQLRVIGPIQIGAGIFEGNEIVIDRGMVGAMKEAEVEYGISIFYPSFIARKVYWQTAEAARKNIFFGQVADEGAVSFANMNYYDDENNPRGMATVQLQLPCLPKVEFSIHWCELIDFPLSFLAIPRLRVPPQFYKVPGPGRTPEMIPGRNSVMWHGQARYEKY